MQLTAHNKVPRLPVWKWRWKNERRILAKKWLAALALITFLQTANRSFAQTVTLSRKETPLKSVLFDIQQQTGYNFLFKESILQKAKPVTIEVKEAALAEVLQSIFKDQPFTYTIKDKSISIIEKTLSNDQRTAPSPESSGISGKVTNEKDEPLAGVTVQIKGTERITSTSGSGTFEFPTIQPNDILVISGAEIETTEVKVGSRHFISVKVNPKIGELDQVVMMAYGQTTKRLNTGNIAKVTSEEISKQPVSNPLTALQGKVPGLIVTQSNGYAGGWVNIQIRGQNSLLQGSEPFFIVDGVPLSTQNNESISQITNAAGGGISGFYTINPSDIESIEILKDADATAIYGSRGANGVVLITTKKGKAGKTNVSVNAYSGFRKVTRTMDMLDTRQYVQMRLEAYAQDGLTPSGSSAADILVWDTTRYTDLKKLLIGGTAHASDINVSVGGGTNNTQFRIGAGYHRETTVLPVDLADHRASVNTSINHTSNDKRFGITLLANYSYIRSNLPGIEPTNYINRPPNMQLYDSSGNLNWQEGGVSFRSATGVAEFSNPLASLKTVHRGNYQSLNSSLILNYKILPYLTIKSSFGYNNISSDEIKTYPTASRDPYVSTQTPRSEFGDMNNRSWIIEPQVEFSKLLNIGKIDVLLGSTLQKKTGSAIRVSASNYQSDLLLTSISGAGTIQSTNSTNEYRYSAAFARFNYNKDDKYIFNFSGRRDGSSRFGPGRRFSNFGAGGVAWIFSNENFISRHLPWLNFGKIRGSYGIAGNDQIGNYRFIETWSTGNNTYQGLPVLNPTALFNPDLAWELTKKLEAALELSVLNQRATLSLSYFRNRSNNQLVSYNLPIQAGFPSVLRNWNALVQNKGYEFVLSTHNIRTRNFSWTMQANMTIARNKLLRFDGLEKSSYANLFVIGQPLSVVKLYKYLGVDQTTGLYSFLDVDNNGVMGQPDQVVIKNVDPKFYGGFSNEFKISNFELSILFQFVKQTGLNYLSSTTESYPPGYRSKNQPAIVMDRWQKPGDQTDIARFTTSAIANEYLAASDAVYGDASFIRCKNISLSYNLPVKIAKSIKASNCQIYIHAQNLFTITNYVGSDPETQNIYRMPPLKSVTAGIQVNF